MSNFNIWGGDTTPAAELVTTTALALPGASAGIGYLAAGTGAVATTVEKKLQERASIFDFLNIFERADVLAGTYLLDVSASVQKALDSAKRIYAPAGGYLCGNLVPPANRTIFGDGFASIFKQSTATAGKGIFFQNSGSASSQITGFTLRDIQVLGTVSTTGFSQFVHLISLNGVKNALLDNVWITGFRGDGVYIGSGDSAGQERHNKNVRIHNCIIDGVNNDNRNGVSVIDGDKISITKCDFLNCTRSNMPGAIDIEPDAVAYAIIKNIRVVGNTFQNCGGNVAHIGAYLVGSTYTVAPTNINISGNEFDGGSVPNFIVVILPPAGYAESTGLVVSGNTGKNTTAGSKPFYFAGINGATITGNIFETPNFGFLGFNATDVVKDVVFSGNSLKGNTSASGLIVRGQVTNVNIIGNTFSGHATSAIQVGIASGAVSKLAISGNTFNSISGANLSVEFTAGTIDGASCTYLGNTHTGTHSFPAWRNDTCGTVSNGVAASNGSWNSLTLPDSFPEGISNAAVNGDTGVPATTGGLQGVLTTYKLSGIASKYTYQTYFHASNTLKLGSFFVRRRDQITNTWTAFVEQAA
jgi:hypothetical protein